MGRRLQPLRYGKQSASLPPSPSVLPLIPGAQRPRGKCSSSQQCPAQPCSPSAWFPGINLGCNKPKPKSQFTSELTAIFLFLHRLSVIYYPIGNMLGPANNNNNSSVNDDNNNSPHLYSICSMPGMVLLSAVPMRQALVLSPLHR